jgi:DNA-binding NarL/FixJ family response regulator
VHPILVLEDDPLVAKHYARILRAVAPVTLASSVTAACSLVTGSTSWSALIFDVRLPDGSGVDVLRTARGLGIRGPARLITGHIDRDLLEAACDLQARCFEKPVPTSLLLRVLEDTLAHAVEDWQSRYGLTVTEAELLHSFASSEERAALAQRLGIAQRTLDAHASNILRKTGDASILHVVIRLLRSTGYEPYRY